MKLSAKTDIEAPIAYVYASLADHGQWEADARRRGIEVERPEGTPTQGVGAAWRIEAPFRGKIRKIVLTVQEMTPHHRLGMGFDGQTFEGEMVLELLAMSPRSTRMRLLLDLRPKTLSARLFLNTLRLAKARVQGRLDTRLRQFGSRIQESQKTGRIVPAEG